MRKCQVATSIEAHAPKQQNGQYLVYVLDAFFFLVFVSEANARAPCSWHVPGIRLACAHHVQSCAQHDPFICPVVPWLCSSCALLVPCLCPSCMCPCPNGSTLAIRLMNGGVKDIWRRASCSWLENLLLWVEILLRCSEIRWGTWWGRGGTWWGHG